MSNGGLKATWAQGVKAMRTIEKLGCLVGVTAILALSVPADAGMLLNKLAANRLAANRLAANRLAANRVVANRLAANRIVTNRLASNKLPTNKLPTGDGAFTDVNVIELPNGIRFTR